MRFLLSLIFIFLTACGNTPQHTNSSISTLSSAVVPDRLISITHEQLGIPYHYGGNQPSEGFDCSGLVQYVYARSGLMVPRSTHAQYRASTAISISNIRPGDMLFFRIDSNKPSHVGIYTGQGRFVHAPSSGKSVSKAKLTNPYWQSHLIGARRFL